jgi:hypothetical protein
MRRKPREFGRTQAAQRHPPPLGEGKRLADDLMRLAKRHALLD